MFHFVPGLCFGIGNLKMNIPTISFQIPQNLQNVANFTPSFSTKYSTTYWFNLHSHWHALIHTGRDPLTDSLIEFYRKCDFVHCQLFNILITVWTFIPNEIHCTVMTKNIPLIQHFTYPSGVLVLKTSRMQNLFKIANPFLI